MKRKVLLLSCALLCSIIARSGVVWTSFPGTAHEGDVITLKGKYVDSSGASYPIHASISEWSGVATFSRIGEGQYKLVHVGSVGTAQVYWYSEDANGRFLSDGWYQFEFKPGTGGGGEFVYHGPWGAELDGPDISTNEVCEYAVKDSTIKLWAFDDEMTMATYICEWRVEPKTAGKISAEGFRAVFEPSLVFDEGSFTIKCVFGHGKDGVIYEDLIDLIASKTTRFQCSLPEFSITNEFPYIYVKPADGIKITCKTPNSIIRYTLDGTEPTEASSLYTAPLDISSNCTLRARAWRTNYLPSDVATIRLKPRDLAIAPIVVTTNLVASADTDEVYWNVTLSTETKGAQIYYALDDLVPHTNATLYTGPFPVYDKRPLWAVATLPNSIESIIYQEIPWPVSLGEAMGMPGWEFVSQSTEAAGNWGQTRKGVLPGEVYAACSRLPYGGRSDLRMRVKGKGRLKFCWRIVEGGLLGSAGLDSYNGSFSFYDGGIFVAERSTKNAGTVNWSSYSHESTDESEREFRWTFRQYSLTELSTAYLDKISWDPYSPWRMSISQDNLTMYDGETVSLPKASAVFAYRDGSKPTNRDIAVNWRIVSGGESVALEGDCVKAIKPAGKAVLEAVYDEPGVRLSALCTVEILPVIVQLRVTGANEVLGGSSYTYSCFAQYSDGSRKKIFPSWYIVSGSSTEGVIATLYRDDGVLKVDSSSTSGQMDIKAVYSDGMVFAATTEVAVVENTLAAGVSLKPGTSGKFTSSSGVPWVLQEGIAHEGRISAKSGDILAGQSSDLETTVEGPGQCSFWWSVSTQKDCGALTFLVDGEVRDSISESINGWVKVEESLGVGSHRLAWRYTKRASSEGCYDCGWIDDFCFDPLEGQLIITGPEDLLAGMTGEYSCKIVYANGDEQIVQPTWSFSSTDSNVKFKSSMGVLTTGQTNANVTLKATYKTDWLDLSTEKVITVVYRTMESLAFEGPAELVSGDSFACLCTLTYSDGTTKQVSPVDADWTVVYSLGDEVRNGILVTVPYYQDRMIEVRASWRENGGFVSCRKSILVKGIKTATCSVGDAIGWSNVVYATSGDVPWIGQTLVSHDGISAAQSGEVREGQLSSLTLSVYGPGTLSYYWKAEGRYGSLTCNGKACDTSVTVDGHGPTQNWHFVSTPLTSLETNSVTWIYKATKEVGFHGCAWIDDVRWEPYKFTALSISSMSATVGAGKTLMLYCYLNYEGGFKLSRKPEWSIISGEDCASIDSTGRLTAKMKSGVVRVMAKMTVEGKERSCVYDVQVVSSLTSLEISGPENACGGETVSYTCFARYDTGEIKTVVPTWTIVTNATGMSYSRLIETIAFDVPVSGGEFTVHATYSEGGVTKTDDKALSVEPAPHKPVKIAIQGEQEMPYDKSIPLECRVTYADRTVSSVTPSWRVISGNAIIDDAGNLHAEAAGTFEIEAIYEENGAVVIDAKKVRLVRVLNAVRIDGPDIVKYSRSTIFSCVAEYNDGTFATVAPMWSLNDENSRISERGELVAGTTGSLVIRAMYEEGGVACASTECVTVYREVVELKATETTVKYGAKIQLQCIAVRLGGGEELVQATWSLESGGAIVTLDEQGCLTAVGRGGGEVWVRATYVEFEDVKFVRMRVIVQPADFIALIVGSPADAKGVDAYCVTSIVIKASMGEIPAYMFRNWSNVVSVVVQEGVTSVGKEAFRDMPALREVELPGSIGTLRYRTFSQDKALESVRLGWGIGNIADGAFLNCEKLKELTFPSSVTNIDNAAMGWCMALQKLTFEGNAPHVVHDNILDGTPHSMLVCVKPWSTGWSKPGSTALPEKWPVGSASARKIAWYDPEMIALEIGKVSDTNGIDLACVTSVVVKAELGTIPNNMFSRWPRLADVQIEEGVGQIGTSFYNCPKLREVKIPRSVKNVGHNAFAFCGELHHADLPDGITEIQNCTFSNCTNLESTVIPDSVRWIGEYAYIACTNLREVTVGAGVTNVGKHAFNGCACLRDVTFRGTVTEFKSDIFTGCKSLLCVTFKGNAPLAVGNNFYHYAPVSLTTYVPYGSTGWAGPGLSALPEKWPVGNSSPRAIRWEGEPESIYVTEGDVTVPVEWVDKYPTIISASGGDRTKALSSVGANGLPLWQSYVADLDPTNSESKFRAFITIENGVPKVTWDPDLGNEKRTYRTFGTTSLGASAEWDDLTGKSTDGYNFFKVTVELPK